MELPYDPGILILGTYLKKPKTLTQKNKCTPIFIAGLFTVAKLWKQRNFPLIDEWVKKWWNIYTMEYCLAIKKNEILPFATSWMDLEHFMLSEISQTERQIPYDFTYM